MKNTVKVVIKDLEEFQRLVVIKGWSKSGFSKEVGISPPYGSQIINGARNPSPKIANKIAEVLEKDFNDIFDVVPS